MKAKVNSGLCSGTGLCQDKSGVSTVIVDKVPSDAEQSCREAMQACPTEAISIEE